MKDQITIDSRDILTMLKISQELVQKAVGQEEIGDVAKISPLAVYLLSKAGYTELTMPDGTPIEKADTIINTTLDFTRGRTLSEEQAAIQLSYIFDKSPYLKMFNSRIVNKLVVPIEATAITSKNLISQEQYGAAITANKRIVHNFGVNLSLKHCQLQKDIPLQTVINNLYNPAWEAKVISDVSTALSNDILLLCINGLGGTYDGVDFYKLNKGFVKILMDADGKNTNTYGDITVTGFLGRYLTPQKIDAVGCTSTNYTAANLLALMRKMYKAMLPEYRNNPNNVFMMSQADLDLYIDSRSDMTSPSNTTREDVLTNGNTPNFMGRKLVAIPGMISIAETHEANSAVPGAIIYGDPKNIDIASDKTTYLKTVTFNARATTGAAYEYTYDVYLDVQVAKPESFVIAYNGAKLSQPVLITPSGALNGQTGEGSLSTSTYTVGKTWDGVATSGTSKFHICCDNADTVVVKSLTDITGASYDTLAEALAKVASDNDPLVSKVVEQNGYFLVAADTTVYVRAYPAKLGQAVTSTAITITVDLA